MKRILIVDDKKANCLFLQRLLSRYEVNVANNGLEALSLCNSGKFFDLIVSDIRMPHLDGIGLLQEIKPLLPETEVILMTAYAEIGQAIKAMKMGAFDYLIKPFDPDEMILVVEKVFEIQNLRKEKQQLQKELDQIKGFGPIVGQSQKMQRIYNLINKMARSDATVLITGESGTGKELVAHCIHENSFRKKGAFVALNCGSLSIDLAESELFGHTKGAFTGAITSKKGLFEEACGGTLFLDEMNSLPLALQVKLNRAIEQKEGRRIGSTETYKIDVRLIATTNTDLREKIEEGTFREDLYFRINVLQIKLPPLRERSEDIFDLTQYFLSQCSKNQNCQVSSEVLKAFLAYPWPGNIRELKNTIEATVVLGDGKQITLNDLPPYIAQTPIQENFPYTHLALLKYKDAQKLSREYLLKHYFISLMKSFQGNVTLASNHAEMGRETLHRLLKKYDIQPSLFRNTN